MKKKIALLLAVIMTLSLMPMTVFAGSSNYLAKGTLSLKKDTKYDGTVEKIANGLVIEFKDEITEMQKFRIELTNAEFSNLSDASESASVAGAATGERTSIFEATATTFTSSTAFAANAAWDTVGGGIIVSGKDSPVVEASGLVEGLPNVATITVTKATADSKMTIVLPIKVKNVDDADVSVAISANNSYVSVGTYLISRTTGSSTTTAAKDIATGRDIIELENIIIKENLVGSFKDLKTDGNAFELVAPSGYEFTKTTGIQVIGTGEHSAVHNVSVTTRLDDTSLIIGLSKSANKVSSVLPESIIISKVFIQPVDEDSIPFGSTLSMAIYKYGNLTGYSTKGLDGLTEQSFEVAKPVDWSVSVTAATAKDVVSGRFDSNRVDAEGQVAAKVTFKELVEDTWISERTTEFTLPEGVTIRGIKFDEWKKMKQDKPTVPGESVTTGAAHFIGKDKWQFDAPALDAGSTAGVITVDKNTLSFKGLQVDDNEKAEIQFTLYLSVSPEYKGETISLSTSGTSIQQDETPDVVIANCIKPITVSVSKVADVQIGFQKYAVGDIIIKENKAGAILRNLDAKYVTTDLKAKAGLELSIKDYISDDSNDIVLVPVTASQVTVDGDLKVTLKKSTNSTIKFDVDRLSTKASTITIKGVEVKINRTVPYGVYDLVVAGQSVFANQANLDADPKQVNSLFDAYGYTVPYINVATEGMNSPLKANVKIAKDSDIVLVDGVQQKMMYPTYFDVEQSSFLVPARFISQIFGVEDNNIFWNDSTKTVSIITANRTLQFTAGSDVMVVAANGAPSNVTMTAKAILHPVTERLYVPFRAIGEAFGVPVAYDEATQMGIYNPVK